MREKEEGKKIVLSVLWLEEIAIWLQANRHWANLMRGVIEMDFSFKSFAMQNVRLSVKWDKVSGNAFIY